MSEYRVTALSAKELGIEPYYNPTEDNLTFFTFSNGHKTAYYDEDERFAEYDQNKDEISFYGPEDDVKEFWDEYSKVHPEGIKDKAEEFEKICHEFMEFTLDAKVKDKEMDDR